MSEQDGRAEALKATALVGGVAMKFTISNTLDRLRSSIGGFTRFKFAGAAISDAGLSHSDLVRVEHQQEMQVALQELRNLVLEAISLETPQRPDPAGYS
jgi:hypothetical protein